MNKVNLTIPNLTMAQKINYQETSSMHQFQNNFKAAPKVNCCKTHNITLKSPWKCQINQKIQD